MPCYSPLRACLVKSPEGRRISFRRDSVGKPLSLPCGKCIGCRLERSRQWAVRLVHESECHDSNSFITLTYSDECLPSNGSISVSVAQLFLKRLRARIAPVKIRFYLCGEYGSKLLRPHYHALIFGYAFPDKVLMSQNEKVSLFRSDLLDDIWGFGFCSIGDVTFDSACYCAKYATKKMFGPKAKDYYGGLTPEFALMSRRPGIGTPWIKKFASDVYPSDEVIINGYPARPPRSYDLYLERNAPELLASIKEKREVKAQDLQELVMVDSGDLLKIGYADTSARLEVRRIVAEAKASLKSRTLES